jgi:hypothetical protein
LPEIKLAELLLQKIKDTDGNEALASNLEEFIKRESEESNTGSIEEEVNEDNEKEVISSNVSCISQERERDYKVQARTNVFSFKDLFDLCKTGIVTRMDHG